MEYVLLLSLCTCTTDCTLLNRPLLRLVAMCSATDMAPALCPNMVTAVGYSSKLGNVPLDPLEGQSLVLIVQGMSAGKDTGDVQERGSSDVHTA